MKFEYDPAKSRSNAQKHGINFEQAQGLWDGRPYVQYRSDQPGEKRLVRLAQIGEANPKLWAAIFTRRGRSIRIISVRRAREKEKALYEEGKAPNR